MSYSVDLGVKIPPQLVDDFLGKLHYVSEALEGFEFACQEYDRVNFQLSPGCEEQEGLVADRIAETARKICNGYRPGEEKVLVDRSHIAVPFSEDPHPLLEARGELCRFGPGRYGIGPLLVRLTEFFDREVVQMTQRFAAEKYQFPSLIGAEVLDRCRYLRSFPHSLTLVSHLREDLGTIQKFAQTVRWNSDRLDFDSQTLSAVECLLGPAVCFHCYAWLQNTSQPKPRAITAKGKCFRFESGGLEGLERLWDFTMRELIFIGPADYVLSERQKVIEETTALLDQWGLKYEIKSATDPFFIDDFSSQATFQRAFDLKFEIRASLPYKSKTLAVGSFNHHQDFFGRSLNIHNEKGEPLHTGCIGYGMERLALAFLAQYGLEPDHWPDSVARECKG